MADFSTDIEVLRNGDSAGNDMVLGLTDPQGGCGRPVRRKDGNGRKG